MLDRPGRMKQLEPLAEVNVLIGEAVQKKRIAINQKEIVTDVIANQVETSAEGFGVPREDSGRRASVGRGLLLLGARHIGICESYVKEQDSITSDTVLSSLL